MEFVKNVLTFGFVGLTLSLTIFGLSRVAPIFFAGLLCPSGFCQQLQTSVLIA